MGRWDLLRAGAMTAEEQTGCGADDVESIGSEDDWDILLALVQIQPPGTLPLAIWTHRLSDKDDRCRLAARLAIHGWLVEVMERANGEWEGRPAGRPYEWRVASGSLLASLLRTTMGSGGQGFYCHPAHSDYSPVWCTAVVR